MLKYYEKDNIQLFLGDCIEILEKATPESVDMIFADPPYMLSNGGITCQAGKVVSPTSFLKAAESVLLEHSEASAISFTVSEALRCVRM